MVNTVISHIACKLLSFSLTILTFQGMNGQTLINTHRLLGTRMDVYEADAPVAGWLFQDSTKYVYTDYNASFTLNAPHLFYEGLEGRLAVFYATMPWLQSGLFPPLPNAIVQPGDRMQFDSSFYFTYDDDALIWENAEITRRYYASNQLLCDEVLDWNMPGSADTSKKIIEYDPYGHVTKYTVLEYIDAEDEMDTISEYTFNYYNDQLIQYTQYVWVMDQRYRGVVTDYTYNDRSLLFEEEKTYYTMDAANLPYQHNKYQAIYNDQGLVVALNRLLKYADEWHASEQKLFDLDANRLLQYTHLWRLVDTTPILSLGVWDTSIRKDYYWTETQLDSIHTQQNTAGVNADLHFVMREEMAYADQQLTHYVTKYIDAAEPATHDYTFEYNDKGRVIHKSYRAEYPLSPYYIAIDSFYTYDVYDNIIKTEQHYGTSYTSPDNIPQEPLRRKFFYYEAQPLAGSGDGPFAIHAFPSPTNDILNIYFFLSDNTSGEAVMHMYAMDGKAVVRAEQFVVHNSYITVDCSRLLSGVYFISATVNGYRAHQRIVVY